MSTQSSYLEQSIREQVLREMGDEVYEESLRQAAAEHKQAQEALRRLETERAPQVHADLTKALRSLKTVLRQSLAFERELALAAHKAEPGQRSAAARVPTADVLDVMHEVLGDSSEAGYYELRDLAASVRTNAQENALGQRIEWTTVKRDDGVHVVVEHNIDTGSTRVVEQHHHAISHTDKGVPA